jgi:hypothetical protein
MKIVLHVGMNKTATTTLQREVFPRLPDLRAVGFKHPGEDPDSPLSVAVRQVTRDDYAPGLLRRRLEEKAAEEERPLLLSEERYTSTLWHSSWEQTVRTADRLAAELPEARILITVRNPADLLVSSYAQYLREGGTGSWRRFVLRSDLRTYDAAAVCRLYEERFPCVRVLLYEDMGELDRFAARLVGALGSGIDPGAVSGWLDASHNAPLSPLAGYAERALNRTLRVSRFNPSPLLPALRRFYLNPIGRGLQRADTALGAGSWRLSRRILQQRRAAAVFATWDFSYPPP